MSKKNVIVGVFVVSAAALFALGLFLIDNQHKAFRRHVEFYTEFANLSGIAKGAKIRVAGMDGGQVTGIQIPDRPSSKFRLKLQVEESLHGLIRKDSFVSIETAGLVGDQFLLIHYGTDHAPPADPKSTLAGKEPLELAALLQKASGIMDQAGDTITDVHTRLNGALDAVTTAVNNTNGVVTDVRAGRGTAGVLLEDPATAARVKQAVANAQQATININAATQKVDSLVTDINKRNLPAKTEETLNNVKSASEQAKQATQQINQSTQQLNATLTEALVKTSMERTPDPTSGKPSPIQTRPPAISPKTRKPSNRSSSSAASSKNVVTPASPICPSSLTATTKSCRKPKATASGCPPPPSSPPALTASRSSPPKAGNRSIASSAKCPTSTAHHSSSKATPQPAPRPSNSRSPAAVPSSFEATCRSTFTCSQRTQVSSP